MSAAPAKLTQPLMGMILFVSSEIMFFGALIGALFSLRLGAEAWPPEGSPVPDPILAGLFTIFLVASSVTQHRGLHAARSGQRTSARNWMGVTLLLGLLFLAGQGYEWRSLTGDGLTIASNSFGTMFFLLTGAHGIHVLGGLVMIGAVATRVATRPRADGAAEAITLYWHFVDAVWLVLFTILYLTA